MITLLIKMLNDHQTEFDFGLMNGGSPSDQYFVMTRRSQVDSPEQQMAGAIAGEEKPGEENSKSCADQHPDKGGDS